MTPYDSLQSSYNTLSSQYNTLNSQLSDKTSQYNNLNSEYNSYASYPFMVDADGYICLSYVSPNVTLVCDTAEPELVSTTTINSTLTQNEYAISSIDTNSTITLSIELDKNLTSFVGIDIYKLGHYLIYGGKKTTHSGLGNFYNVVTDQLQEIVDEKTQYFNLSHGNIVPGGVSINLCSIISKGNGLYDYPVTTTYKDDGTGNLLENGTVIGTIDYDTGKCFHSGSTVYVGAVRASYQYEFKLVSDTHLVLSEGSDVVSSDSIDRNYCSRLYVRCKFPNYSELNELLTINYGDLTTTSYSHYEYKPYKIDKYNYRLLSFPITATDTGKIELITSKTSGDVYIYDMWME